VPLADLDRDALAAHLGRSRDNVREMVYRHHIFTVPSVLPVGRYLANVMEWTGLDAGTLLAPFKGTTPVSLGAYEQLLDVGAAVRESGVGPGDYAGMTHKEALTALSARQDRLGGAVRAYLDAIGWRLAGGYDVADLCAIELPELLLNTIWNSPQSVTRPPADASDMARVRDAVPSQQRARFDDLVSDVQQVNRLRDERGVFNDLWGTGIARHAILEVGRRLAEAGRIDHPQHAIDATFEELLAMLHDGTGPSREELADRAEWRQTGTVSEADQLLGPPPAPPPPLDGLPPHAAEAMRAFGAALAALFVHRGPDQSATVVGKPVSPGVYTGTARIVRDAGQFMHIQKGDILVTPSTSAGVNVLLPLLGAIVTDRGGQLSHAAIVAREYGIPAVVGTINATSVIPDGSRIRVDGAKGTVELL
jgi:pyruvate,water dikinase